MQCRQAGRQGWCWKLSVQIAFAPQSRCLSLCCFYSFWLQHAVRAISVFLSNFCLSFVVLEGLLLVFICARCGRNDRETFSSEVFRQQRYFLSLFLGCGTCGIALDIASDSGSLLESSQRNQALPQAPRR